VFGKCQLRDWHGARGDDELRVAVSAGATLEHADLFPRRSPDEVMKRKTELGVRWDTQNEEPRLGTGALRRWRPGVMKERTLADVRRPAGSLFLDFKMSCYEIEKTALRPLE
jgi:hypothetical protein